MCGRFTQSMSWRELVHLYRMPGSVLPAPLVPPLLVPRWNGAPTQTFVVCRQGEAGEREITAMRWGLIPSWAGGQAIGNRLANARSETAASKPSFRAAFRRRRCLVPATGWFEWQRTDAGKQPFWIALAHGEPFSFAGLWERWERGSESIESFTIVTCPATKSLEWVHARQSAIIASDVHDEWLDDATPTLRRLALVQAPHQGPYALRRVSTLVNSPRNDTPEILCAVE